MWKRELLNMVIGSEEVKGEGAKDWVKKDGHLNMAVKCWMAVFFILKYPCVVECCSGLFWRIIQELSSINHPFKRNDPST